MTAWPAQAPVEVTEVADQQVGFAIAIPIHNGGLAADAANASCAASDAAKPMVIDKGEVTG